MLTDRPTLIATLAGALALVVVMAPASVGAYSLAEEQAPPPDALYLSTTLFPADGLPVPITSVGATYSHHVNRYFAWSIGLGASAIDFWGIEYLVAVPIAAHLTLGDTWSPHSFEVALGVAPLLIVHQLQPFVLPTAFLGYRYQPASGGAMVRVGPALNFGVGIALELSIGWRP